MTNKTLYISDLDGTLLNSNKEISEYTRNTLNTLIAEGLHFTIATARTAASTVLLLKELNLREPVVLMNGAAIYDIVRDEYINIEEIPEQTANNIINNLKEFGMTGFMYTITGGKLITFYENLSTPALKAFYDERTNKYYKKFDQVDSFLSKTKDNNVVYFCLLDEYNKLSIMKDELKRLPDIDSVLYRDIYAEDLWYLEIYSINASKYNAVKYLRDNFKFDRIIGFGDNLNDIPLFKACDEGYAVENAVDELKEIAAGVISNNNEDGVTKFISKG